MNTKEIGNIGEEIACNYLISKGYYILDRNYFFEKNEIDIVAFNLQEVIFVEVKTRSNDLFVFPEFAVDEAKMNRIKIAAQSYLFERKLENCPCRFDVISIVLNDQQHQLQHFEDVFR